MPKAPRHPFLQQLDHALEAQDLGRAGMLVRGASPDVLSLRFTVQDLQDLFVTGVAQAACNPSVSFEEYRPFLDWCSSKGCSPFEVYEGTRPYDLALSDAADQRISSLEKSPLLQWCWDRPTTPVLSEPTVDKQVEQDILHALIGSVRYLGLGAALQIKTLQKSGYAWSASSSRGSCLLQLVEGCVQSDDMAKDARGDTRYHDGWVDAFRGLSRLVKECEAFKEMPDVAALFWLGEAYRQLALVMSQKVQVKSGEEKWRPAYRSLQKKLALSFPEAYASRYEVVGAWGQWLSQQEGSTFWARVGSRAGLSSLQEVVQELGVSWFSSDHHEAGSELANALIRQLNIAVLTGETFAEDAWGEGSVFVAEKQTSSAWADPFIEFQKGWHNVDLSVQRQAVSHPGAWALALPFLCCQHQAGPGKFLEQLVESRCWPDTSKWNTAADASSLSEAVLCRARAHRLDIALPGSPRAAVPRPRF